MNKMKTIVLYNNSWQTRLLTQLKWQQILAPEPLDHKSKLTVYALVRKHGNKA